MESMNCTTCVQKHLAAALSYGKEILSGHSSGAELDHRIDFLGEISNAEHHLELINADLFEQVSSFRKALQEKGNVPDFADLAQLRKFFYSVDQMMTVSTQSNVLEQTVYSEPLDIVFPKIENPEYFRFIYESIQKHASGIGKLYFLEAVDGITEIEKISGYGDEKLSENFIIWPERTCLLKDFDLMKVFPAFSYPNGGKGFAKTVAMIRSKSKDAPILLFDGIVPQPVSKVKFQETQKLETAYPLSLYFAGDAAARRINAMNICPTVSKEICCSVKSRLKTALYANWTEAGFLFLQEYLKNQEEK